MGFIDRDEKGVWKYGDAQRTGYGFQLSSAQIIAGTAVNFLTAPSLGGSYVFVPTALYAEFVYVSSASTYVLTSAPLFTVTYHGKTSPTLIVMACTGLIDQSASTFSVANPVATITSGTSNYGRVIANTNCAGLGLDIAIPSGGGSAATGTGVVNFFIEYDQIAVF